MMLSRAKPAVADTPPPLDRRRKKGKKVPQLEELLALRDFTGAIALLEFKRQVGEQEEDTDLWMGYCAFHLGDYKRALEVRWGNTAPRGWKSGCDKAMTKGRRCSVIENSSTSQLRHKCMVIR
uniref:Intraflagellar transport protein 56 n=2 Tax=Psittaciformes TaxID=9223 RepID=A0A8B9F460_9PSIT